MSSEHTQFITYHLSTVAFQVDGREDSVYPVMRRCSVRDGTANFVKSENICANTIEEFREMYPNTPVEGMATKQNVSSVLSELSDEELAELGLQRAATPELAFELSEDLFASEEAYELALRSLSPEQLDGLTAGDGNGKNGTFNTADIRYLADALAD